MKQLSSFQLSLTFVGVFLGAGFVSGQEIWQFFACFGPFGFLAFAAAIALFYLVHSTLIRLVWATGEEAIGRLMTPEKVPMLRVVINVMQYLFLFGVVVIMTAGAALSAAMFILIFTKTEKPYAPGFMPSAIGYNIPYTESN